MSMCTPCKEAADRRQEINGLFRRHACVYPHSCTCQHSRTVPIPTKRKRT